MIRRVNHGSTFQEGITTVYTFGITPEPKLNPVQHLYQKQVCKEILIDYKRSAQVSGIKRLARQLGSK